jgi:flagellin
MGLRVSTNVQSLAAQRAISEVKMNQDKSLEKLSSGNRISRAGDDAAGLAISEKLKADIRGSQQASRNAGDGISLIQVAEGGLNEVSNILIRLRELGVQASSDTVGDTERRFSDLEFQSLTQEIERIAQSTQFNGRNLLDGEGDLFDFQIGTGNDSFKDRISYDASKTNATVNAIGVNGLAVSSKEDAQGSLESLDNAITSINANRANLGALQNRLQSTVNNLEIKVENISAANSRIRDTDIAKESAELAKSNILMASSTSALAQANNVGASALKLIG